MVRKKPEIGNATHSGQFHSLRMTKKISNESIAIVAVTATP